MSARPCVRERAKEVVGEHLGVTLGTTERLRPIGGAAVFLFACSARDLVVRNVSEQDVPKRILGLAGDRRATSLLHKLLALQSGQQLLGIAARLVAIPSSATGQNTSPTIPPSWSTVFPGTEGLSSRAAMIPWTVSGNSSTIRLRPRRKAGRTGLFGVRLRVRA